MKQPTFPASTDPLVQALQSLVLNTRGGCKAVAEKIGANDQSLYQVVTCRPDSKTGKPKSVGKQLRDKLDDAYPGWQEMAGVAQQLAPNPPPAPTNAQGIAPVADTEALLVPTLAQALQVLLDAIAESPHRAELRQLLPMLVDTNAPAYRQRLGELLAPVGTANPTNPAIQAQTHDFAGKPPQIHNKETAGKAPATHRAGNFIKP